MYSLARDSQRRSVRSKDVAQAGSSLSIGKKPRQGEQPSRVAASIDDTLTYANRELLTHVVSGDASPDAALQGTTTKGTTTTTTTTTTSATAEAATKAAVRPTSRIHKRGIESPFHTDNDNNDDTMMMMMMKKSTKKTTPLMATSSPLTAYRKSLDALELDDSTVASSTIPARRIDAEEQQRIDAQRKEKERQQSQQLRREKRQQRGRQHQQQVNQRHSYHEEQRRHDWAPTQQLETKLSLGASTEEWCEKSIGSNRSARTHQHGKNLDRHTHELASGGRGVGLGTSAIRPYDYHNNLTDDDEEDALFRDPLHAIPGAFPIRGCDASVSENSTYTVNQTSRRSLHSNNDPNSQPSGGVTETRNRSRHDVEVSSSGDSSTHMVTMAVTEQDDMEQRMEAIILERIQQHMGVPLNSARTGQSMISNDHSLNNFSNMGSSTNLTQDQLNTEHNHNTGGGSDGGNGNDDANERDVYIGSDKVLSSRRTYLVVACCTILLIVSLVVGLVVAFQQQQQQTQQQDDPNIDDGGQRQPTPLITTVTPSVTPTMAPTTQLQAHLVEVLSTITPNLEMILSTNSNAGTGNGNDNDVSDSPQRLAVQWLLENEEPAFLFSLQDSELRERYASVTLWFTTNGADWDFGARFLNPGVSVCDWNDRRNTIQYGILCNPTTKRVIDIAMSEYRTLFAPSSQQ